MPTVKKVGLTVTAVCATAAVATLFLKSPGDACCTSVGGWNIDWLKSLIGIGGVTSLPALVPKIFDGLKYLANLVPALRGTKIDDRLIGGAQIATYAGLVATATSTAQRDGLVAAGRAACDEMKEELFPVTPAKPVQS